MLLLYIIKLIITTSCSPSLWTSSHHARLLWCSSGPWSFWGPPPHSPHVYGCHVCAPHLLSTAHCCRCHLQLDNVSVYMDILIKCYIDVKTEGYIHIQVKVRERERDATCLVGVARPVWRSRSRYSTGLSLLARRSNGLLLTLPSEARCSISLRD